MAIGITTLTSGQDTTDGTSVTTASIAPAGNALILAWIVGDKNAASPAIPTCSGGGMTTWDKITEQLYDGSTIYLTLFRALQASPGSGTVTFDFGGVTHATFGWGIVEVTGLVTTGTNGSGAIQQSKKGSGTDSPATVTFDAGTGATNMVLGVCARVGTNPIPVVPTGWTSAFGIQMSGPASALRGAYFNGADDSMDWTFSGVGNWGVVGVEVVGDTGTPPINQHSKFYRDSRLVVGKVG
jgi:hypothetical protein